MELAQHITQADLRVFGDSYLANCSSVDGQSAFLGEDADHSHIEFFQGLERFHEDGLPSKLPAKRIEELKKDPGLLQRQDVVNKLVKSRSSIVALNKAKSELSQHWKTLEREARKTYQRQWVSDRRDWEILTRGKEIAKPQENVDILQCLFQLIPERKRLAHWMAAENPLPSQEMWQAMADIHTLLTKDLTVIYLPGHEPIEGTCPVKRCEFRLARYVLYRFFHVLFHLHLANLKKSSQGKPKPACPRVRSEGHRQPRRLPCHRRSLLLSMLPMGGRRRKNLEPTLSKPFVNYCHYTVRHGHVFPHPYPAGILSALPRR